MKKLAGILVLLLFIPADSVSQQPILLIELSSDGEATVTQLLSAKSIVSSISVPLISDRTSKVLVTDERGILLKTTQSGNSLNIASLGATGITLTYKADITTFDSQAWNVSYDAETETVVSLPQLATIVSVSSIPIDIEDNAIIMPPGSVSITYTINEVSTKTFFVLEGGQNYPVEITSASKIDDFFKQSNEIRFGISTSTTLLVIVPSVVLPNPIDASLNGGKVSFNPYYHNGTHNWIRIDPHEAGIIEIGGDVRASQIISNNPMTNEGSGENDSIFLTVGIILGVLAVGYVIFRKYFKIGLVRTSSSKGSNRLVKSRKHVKKNVKGSHIGIFALAFLTLLLTVPSAFAQVTEDHPGIVNSASNANAVYALMEKITDGQDELATLDDLITSNGLNMGTGLTEYADALEQAAYLASSTNPADWDEAADILYGSEEILDDIYTQLYAQVDSRQNERFTDFVDSAITSLTFLVENGENLGLSQVVIGELDTTLTILLNGDTEEILDVTGEHGNLGLVSSIFSDDVTNHPGFGKAGVNPNDKAAGPDGKGRGLGLGIEDRLPPGIAARYELNTVSDPSIQSIDGTGDENNGFFESLDGFGAASDEANENALENGQGIGLMKIPWIFDYGFTPDSEITPPPFDETGDKVKFDGRAHGAQKRADAQERADDKSGGKSGGGKPDDPGPPGGPPGGPP